MQNRFTPEQLGMISSSAFFCIIFELIFYWATLYLSNITASMKFLDLVAFSGYKFVMMNVCILVSIVFKQFGFYSAWLYTSISIAFFLVCPTIDLLIRFFVSGMDGTYLTCPHKFDLFDFSFVR